MSKQEQELTPWFPSGTKPERVGAYETIRDEWSKAFRWWNGSAWGLGFQTPAQARKGQGNAWSAEEVSWRGLAAPAKE